MTVLATKLPSAGTLALLAAGAVVVIAALAVLFRRREGAFPLLVVATLPFRLPISTDERTVNLLVPLYVVIAAGVVALGLPRLWARVRARDDFGRGHAQGVPAEHHAAAKLGAAATAGQRPQREDPAVRYAAVLLAVAVVLYALQATYSDDRAKAAENIVFFYVPFGLMFALLREVSWTRELLLRCLAVVVALAVLFAGVGFVEYARKSLFLNPKVVEANQYDNYFRVNSVFFDPSIYGRFLAIVMIAVTTVVLWGRRRVVLAGAAVLAWLLAGLITSFSQSSIAALLVGLAVLAAWRWDARRTALAAVGLLALAGVVVLLAPASWHFGLKGKGGSTSNATSGRASLVEGGLELFGARPLQGFGSGSFEKEYKAHSGTDEENATSASHTIPITIAAEQGVIGLVVYFALVVTALLALFERAGRSPPRIAIAACFAALVLHTWTYADFLEDPFTWALLAIGLALARGEPRGGRAAPA